MPVARELLIGSEIVLVAVAVICVMAAQRYLDGIHRWALSVAALLFGAAATAGTLHYAGICGEALIAAHRWITAATAMTGFACAGAAALPRRHIATLSAPFLVLTIGTALLIQNASVVAIGGAGIVLLGCVVKFPQARRQAVMSAVFLVVFMGFTAFGPAVLPSRDIALAVGHLLLAGWLISHIQLVRSVY